MAPPSPETINTHRVQLPSHWELTNMEKEVFKIGGKVINELRVVDLKKELEKRGLSKSGSKIELIKRLKTKMRIERLHSDASEDEIPNRKLSESVGEQSDFVKQYLEKQQRTYTQMRHEKEQYQVLQRESENEQSDNDSIHKQEESKKANISMEQSINEAKPQITSQSETKPPKTRRGQQAKTKKKEVQEVEPETKSQASLDSEPELESQSEQKETMIEPQTEKPSTTVSDEEAKPITEKPVDPKLETSRDILDTPKEKEPEELKVPEKIVSAVEDESDRKQSNDDNATTKIEESIVSESQNTSSSSSSDEESDSKSESIAEKPETMIPEECKLEKKEVKDDSSEEKLQEKHPESPAVEGRTEEKDANQKKQLPKRITSSSIKEMFGHIKPQSPSNKISESDNGDQRKVLTPVDEIKRTIIQDVKRSDDVDIDETNEISMEVGSDTSDVDMEPRNDARVVEFKKDGDRSQASAKRKPISPPTSENASKKRIVATTRQSSRVDVDDSLKPIKEKSPSPARHPSSRVLLIRNLVRPFTVPQLKNILNRHGSIIDKYFWIDNIKTHCYAMYETQELATETRESLHNSRWPSSNPKLLTVDFATEEDVYRHLLAEKPDIAKKMEVHKEQEEKSKPEKVEEENGSKKWGSKTNEEDRDKDRKVERERRVSERDRGFDKEKENRDRGRRQHIREWDRGKTRHSPSPQGSRRGDRGYRRSRSPRRRSSPRRQREERPEKPVDDAPAKLLDDLFHKTEANPSIYWLPLSDEGARLRDENRRKEKEDREQKRRDREEEERQRRRKEIYDTEPKTKHDESSRRRRRASSSD